MTKLFAVFPIIIIAAHKSICAFETELMIIITFLFDYKFLFMPFYFSFLIFFYFDEFRILDDYI